MGNDILVDGAKLEIDGGVLSLLLRVYKRGNVPFCCTCNLQSLSAYYPALLPIKLGGTYLTLW